MPFQRRRKCIFHWRGRAWLTIWDKVKIPRYSHKLMHRKRVTCELLDSYFRSMTIKTCHSKDDGSAYSDGQLWGDIEWVLNYYITQCTGNSISLERRCGREKQHPAESWTLWVLETRPVWRQDVVEKASTQQRAGPRASIWATLENEKETLMAIRVGVNMLQFCSVCNSLSHTTLSNKVRGIFF